MAQNFWGASWAWTICFLVTIAISVATPPKGEAELKGLVYGLTPRPSDEGLAWWQRPALLGTVVLVLVAALNLIFW
jgi:SSS family solute:Na+ symporter